MITNAARSRILELVALEAMYFKVSNAAIPDPESVDDSGFSPIFAPLNGGITAGATAFTKTLLLTDKTTDVVAQTITVNCVLLPGEGNGSTWTEVVLFDSNDRVITREIVDSPEPKVSSKEFNYKIVLTLF